MTCKLLGNKMFMPSSTCACQHGLEPVCRHKGKNTINFQDTRKWIFGRWNFRFGRPIVRRTDSFLGRVSQVGSVWYHWHHEPWRSILSVWVLSTARTPWHVMTIGDNLETEQLPWLKNATSHNPPWCFVARRRDSLKHHTTNHETKSWKKTSILSDIRIMGQVPKQITLFIRNNNLLIAHPATIPTKNKGENDSSDHRPPANQRFINDKDFEGIASMTDWGSRLLCKKLKTCHARICVNINT